MIAIVDYGVGNLFSLKSSFDAIGVDCVVTAEEAVLRSADKILLPGVGAFADAAGKLRDSGLADLPVIDTGDRAPGVSLKHASGEFLDFMKKADLVIAKGQGNFESLNDAPEAGNTFFLFRVKCPVIEQLTGEEKGSLQIRSARLLKHECQ